MGESNNKKIKKIKVIILKHRIVCTTGLLILGLVMVILLAILFGRQQSLLQNLYVSSQLVSAFFVMAGVVIAGWQYYLTSGAELSKLQLEKVQKSVELSKFYKDNILDKFSAVKYVYKKTGIIDIIQKIKKDDMREFTANEMRRILSEKDIMLLKKTEQSDDFLEAVLEANTIYHLELHIVKKLVEVEKNQKFLIDRRSVLNSFFADLLSGIMNDLEIFAMYFTHKAADDTVVFQSLHQTYLQIVQTFYYQISVMNDMRNGSYYTNTIELYSKWYKKSLELYGRQARISAKGTIVKDID